MFVEMVGFSTGFIKFYDVQTPDQVFGQTSAFTLKRANHRHQELIIVQTDLIPHHPDLLTRQRFHPNPMNFVTQYFYVSHPLFG
jgi:hypothetical protein